MYVTFSGWSVCFFLRKSMMSIKFPPTILGPEMAAPILWAPGIFWFFLLENPHAHKIPPFRGGCWGFLEGGWKCQFYFYGRGDFSEFCVLVSKKNCIFRVFVFCKFEHAYVLETVVVAVVLG